MAYALLNPSAVGFDVVRRPAAGRVASVFLVAATATPALLVDLARRHPLAELPAGARRAALAESAALREIRAASFPVLSRPDTGGARAVRADRARVEPFELGGAHEVEPYVSGQLLGLPATSPGDEDDVGALAADLLAEAAVTAWTARAADPADDAYRAVRQVASGNLRRADLGPHTARLVALLDRLPTGPGRWAALLDRERRRVDPDQWTEAMQEAACAAWLSGRERPAVAAQMLAVIALSERRRGLADRTARVWDVVSGMVAAAVVQDLLPATTAEALSGPGTGWWSRRP